MISIKTLSALTVSCLWVAGLTAGAKEKAADQWVEQRDVKLSHKRQIDGDSFGMVVKTAQGNDTIRTYRLYGTDCPESAAGDKVLEGRIQDQAKWFGCEPGAIPAMGKKAAAFTEKLLADGKPEVWTRGKLGEEVQKAPGRPQRYYALIKVTAANGERVWLHQLLLQEGYARAFGHSAAWPPAQVDRNGENAAREKFMKDLRALEKGAQKASLGLWKKPVEAQGQFR